MGRRVLACLLVVFMLSALLPQQAFGATLLRRGSRGPAVQQLQQQLIKLGFLQGSADGIFGPQTEAAVRSFQKAYGLKQDGIAGPATLSKLAEVLSGSSGSTGSSPAPAPELPSRSESSSVPITTTLRLGSRGSQVVTLQKRLNELGYNCGVADGIFGSRTRQAVMAFQRDNGLAVDGIVGPKTVAKLFAESNPPQNQNPEPSAPPSAGEQPSRGSGNGNQNATPPITTTLRLGSRGSQVVTLQKRLNELGYNCGVADGIFGSRTRQAVMAFQRDNGLAVDGIVGPKTVAKLFPVQPPQNPQPQPQPQPQPEPKPEPKPEPEPGPQPQPQPKPGFTQFHGTPGALVGKVIFVDAGHGGTDPGATREHQGYGLVKEKDIVFDIALRLKRILEEAGATVILTRPDDRYYSLFYRSALVNTYILQVELDSLKQEKENIEKDKYEKEITMKDKEQQKALYELAVGDREKALIEYKRNLEEYQLQKSNLISQQAVVKVTFEQKDSLYLSIYDAHQTKKEQLDVHKKLLEDLLSQKNNFQQQKDKLTIEISTIQGQINELKSRLQSLEKQLNELPEGHPDREVIIQEIGQIQLKLKEAEALLGQKKTEEAVLDARIKDVDLQIDSLVMLVKQYEEDLALLASELATIKAERDLAKTQLDLISRQLEELEVNIEKTEEAIVQLEKITKEAAEIIPKLEEEIDSLRKEVEVLSKRLNELNQKIALYSERIKQFEVYLKNPQLADRVGIYAGQLIDGKRYATSDLVEVFDLTRQKYQNDYLFISLHCNSTAADEQTSSSGISVFYRDNGPYSYNGTYGVNVDYYKGYNAAERERFATILLQQLNATTNFSKKYTVPYKADFSVLRENNVISVLVEVGFINNPNDRALLINQQTREDVAAGIYKGIVEYYKR